MAPADAIDRRIPERKLAGAVRSLRPGGKGGEGNRCKKLSEYRRNQRNTQGRDNTRSRSCSPAYRQPAHHARLVPLTMNARYAAASGRARTAARGSRSSAAR